MNFKTKNSIICNCTFASKRENCMSYTQCVLITLVVYKQIFICRLIFKSRAGY